MGLEDREIVEERLASESFTSYLAPEDAQDYQDYALRHPNAPFKAGEDSEQPFPREAFISQLYAYTTESPNAADAIASAFLLSQGGAASERQYGSDFEGAYRRPDGTEDTELRAQDEFVVTMEQAYYNTGGSIPLTWYATYSEDLALFGEVGEWVVEAVYSMSLLQSRHTNLLAGDTELATRRLAIGQAEMDEYEKSQETVFGGLWTREQTQGAAQDYSQLFGMTLKDQLPPEPVVSGILSVGNFLVGAARGLDNWLNNGGSWLMAPGDWWSNNPVTDLVFDGPEQLIGGMIGVAADQFEGGPIERVKKQQEAIDDAEGLLGMTGKEWILEAGFDKAFEFALGIKELDPESWALWMEMAGGDEGVATDMVVDQILFSAENEEAQRKQHEAFNAQTEVIIQELKDHDFSNVENVMAVIASYGEILTAIATGATLIVVNFLDTRILIDPQFWQDMKNYESPAHVLGIEGTGLGLAFNYGSMIVVDPLFPVFRAPLGAVRWGASSRATIKSTIKSPVHKMNIENLVEVVGKSQTDDFGGLVMMNVLDQTGNIERATNAILGEAAGLPGFSIHLPKPGLANVYEHVSVEVFAPFADDVAKVTDDAIEAAGKRIANRGSEPLEMVLNPSSGRHSMSADHLAELAFYQREGHRLVPAVIKLDTKMGLSASRKLVNFTDEEAEFIHKIAEGSKAKDLRIADGYVKGGNEEIAKRTSSAIELIRKRVKEKLVGTATNPKTKEVYKIMVAGDDATGKVYFLVNSEGKSLGGVLNVKGNVTMGLDDAARGTMSQIWDAAAANGDNLILSHGKSGSTSENAIKFAQKYAKSIVDDTVNDSVRFKANTAHPKAEWGKGLTADGTHALDVDGALYVRPRNVIPDDITYGPIDRKYLDAIMERHLLDGGDPLSADRVGIAVAVGKQIRDLMINSPNSIVQWGRQLINRVNANTLMQYHGPTGISQITETGARMFASVDDLGAMAPFSRRVMQFQNARGVIAGKIADLELANAAIIAKIKRVRHALGDSLDGGAGALGVKLTSEQQAARHLALKEINKLKVESAALKAEMAPLSKSQFDYSELTSIWEDMWEAFRRDYINTNPAWKDFLVDGEVPWEALISRDVKRAREYEAILKRARDEKIDLVAASQAEKGFVPDSVLQTMDVIEGLGISVEDFLQATHGVLQHKSSWLAPASPLEMMAAATGGPRTLKTVTAQLFGDRVQEVVHNVHLAWVMDKVVTPRTGIVISMDELITYLQAAGGRSVFTFIEDKAAKIAQNVVNLKGGSSWELLPKRWKERLTKLEEYPIIYNQMERSWIETRGVGTEAITYKKGKIGGNDEYYFAAQREAQGFLTNEGFIAHLQGDEAFAKFMESKASATLARELEFLDAATGKTRTGATIEQLRAGYETQWQVATGTLKAKDVAKAKKIWLEAAAVAKTKGSTAGGPTQLPRWVLEGFGTVTGNVGTQAGIVGKVAGGVMNRLFTQPLNSRRGMISEGVRKSERGRLDQLFADQGRKIMSEQDIFNILRRQYPNAPDELITAAIPKMSKHLQETQGMVTEKYVRELIESKVVYEVERRMYSFTNESQAGRKVVGVAPFGKPFAEMMGRYSREMFARPQLRGYINNANFLGLGKMANKLTDSLPFNPRTVSFISRVANTDFDLDRIQEGPILGDIASAIGLESLDVGKGLFIFHQGQSPITVLLPGLGIVPIAGIDRVFDHFLPDPIKDPLGYERYMDQWSEWVPSLGYSTPHGIAQYGFALLAGGGTTSKGIKLGEAFAQLLTGEPYGQHDIQQSWRTRVEGNRAVKVALSDPSWIDELADLNGVTMELGITAFMDETIGGVLSQAERATAANAMKEIGFEIMRPVGAVFDSPNDDLANVWIDGMELMGLELPAYMNTDTPEAERRAANWVRTQYHAMPEWEQDLAVANNSGLAVNLVSGWKWSSVGLAAQIPGNDLPYRTGGSKKDFASHTAYQDQGWIEPLTSRELVTNIVGTVLTARERTAKAAYTEAVTIANNERWEELVENGWAEWLDDVADELSGDGTLPYRTGRELWDNFTSLKIEYDRRYPAEEGEPGFSMPRPWSAEMPSTPEELNQAFVDETGWLLKEITPKLARLLPGIGLSYDVNQGSETVFVHEIYKATANKISETSLDNPIFAHLAAGYTAWKSPRSAGFQTFNTFFGKTLDGDAFNAETRAGYKQDLVWIGEALDRKDVGDPSWRTIRDEAVARYSRMMQDDAFNKIDGGKMWNDAYGKTLGAYDWIPDEPPPLFNEDGSANPNASQIYVRDIVDGDTINVSFGPPGMGGGSTVYAVRLLGWNAQELGQGGEVERDNLEAALEAAINRGLPITIVRDPDRYGNTDMYDRMFGWLYIGADPWYNPDTMIPRTD